MIDEKKLIESLRASLNTGKECFPIDLIIECIEEQPKVGEWIPCSERLPEEEQEVLLQFEDNMAVGFYFVEGGCFDGTTNWYGLADNDSYTDCDSKPIAWQPLPESYKPGKE
ncbi:MAG: DUF551 domain-containing protein [Lachnospiraceae bacterium]